MYGFCPPDTDENGVTNPFNDYGRSKLEGETVLEAWYAEAPVTRNVTILRPTVVFGEGNRGNVYNLLNLIARQIWESKFFKQVKILIDQLKAELSSIIFKRF